MRSSNTPLTLCGLCLTFLVACSPDRNALNWLHKTERQWSKMEKQQPEWPEMLDSTALQKRLDFLAMALAKTQDWRKQALEPAAQNKLAILEARLKSAQDLLKSQKKDPSVYNIGFRLRALFAPDQAFEMSELDELLKYLDQAPTYYRQAKQKLQEPIPVQCDSAITQHVRSITYLREELGKKIVNSDLPKVMSKQLMYKIDQSCLYMKDYLAWCRSIAFEARN